ncbi:MAG: PIN domain-containing protein [Acidobacteria bacterium]|nr:PIN domain-containing protein [Acidobacteriota bacterium]MBI3654800.1 PIN domain-containing protein [Acidobacteriota bacterium]
MIIYLDVCCLNRPFDNLTQDRVRLESEAVLTILSRGETESWTFLNSEVVDAEVSKIVDGERRQKVCLVAAMAQSYVLLDETAEKRALALRALGFKAFDALHVACAEKGHADILLTTDDHLLRKASQNKATLDVRVENPVKWLMEAMKE